MPCYRLFIASIAAFGQSGCVVPIFAIFLMGVVNFAMHRAVQESGHPMLSMMPGFTGKAGRRGLLAFEFVVLLAAMLLARHVGSGWVVAYALYTAANALAAWLILSHRV